MKTTNSLLCTTFLLIVLSVSGCSLKLSIQDPQLSDVSYVNTSPAQATIAIVDKRKGNDAKFIMGKIGIGSDLDDLSNVLVIDNIKDPIAFFSINLEKELNRRGIPVKCVVANASEGQEMVLEINRYQIHNYRATGFSPWEAGHLFDGTMIHGDKRKNIKAYFYNGKVPVWSMDEIQEPCFATPSSALIKDVASKVNRHFFNLQTSDTKVGQLSQEVESELAKGASPLWKVLELGYTNNDKAMVPLKEFSSKGDNLFKSGALSSIGMLGQEDQLEFLKERYNNGTYNEKYMAAKAIGDIGNEDSRTFLKQLKNEKIYHKEGGLKSCVDLYVP